MTVSNRHIFTVCLGVLMLLRLSVPAAESGSGWVPLFNRKNLDNWVVRGDRGLARYHIENDMIVGTTVDKSKNTFLCTKRDYADFELTFDVRCDKPLNAGVQIRSHVHEKDTPWPGDPTRTHKKGEVFGYQCEIVAREKAPNAGRFYDEGRWMRWLDDDSRNPQGRTAYNDGEWNHYRIVAQGDHLRSWMNGIPRADCRDSMDATGFIGLQVHGIPAGKGPYQVRWKNIMIRELAPGEIVK